MRRAVFLDRDGTINEEVGYLDGLDRLRLIPGAAEAIRLPNKAGVLVIVVSNQAGIGRGYFSAAVVEAIHERLTEKLARYPVRGRLFSVSTAWARSFILWSSSMDATACSMMSFPLFVLTLWMPE